MSCGSGVSWEHDRYFGYNSGFGAIISPPAENRKRGAYFAFPSRRAPVGNGSTRKGIDKRRIWIYNATIRI